MKIALFDMDGTITTRDTLFHFIHYAVGTIPFVGGFVRLSSAIVAHLSGKLSNHALKEKVLCHFFKGWQEDVLVETGRQYCRQLLPSIIKSTAIDRIHWHQHQGHDVVIVSASVNYWIEPWCQALTLPLISTRLETRDGKLTGRYATPNCHGLEKVNRIKTDLDLSRYDYIYAYGDSRGDREMLALANESFYRFFK
jgi:phosphatidylglycerophosphatase C